MNGFPEILPEHQRSDLSAIEVPNLILPKRTGTELFRSSRSPVDRWYAAGRVNGVTGSTRAPTANTIYAMPFVSMQGGTIDKIAFDITGAGSANSHIRCGIYSNVSDTDTRPGYLIFDAGEFAGNSTGVKSTDCNIFLEPGQLYWFAIVADGTTPPTVRAATVGSTYPILGKSKTGTTTNNHWTGSFTYGALGAFPTPTAAGESIPEIRVHFKDFANPTGQPRGYEYYKYNSSSVYHVGGVQNANLNSTQLAFGTILYLVPFCYPKGGYVNEIVCNGTGSNAAGNCRLGIYTSYGQDLPHPFRLLCDSGDMSTAVGQVRSYIPQGIYFEPDQLYWLAYCQSASMNRYRVEHEAQFCLLGNNGTPATANNACGMARVVSYGALPMQFNLGEVLYSDNSVIPEIAVSLRQ